MTQGRYAPSGTSYSSEELAGISERIHVDLGFGGAAPAVT